MDPARAGPKRAVTGSRRWARPVLGGAVLLAGLALRLAVSTGSGYLGEDGDLFEWRLATHRALTRGPHTVYEVNRENDPAFTGREWAGGYFINTPPVLLYLRTAVAAAYRALDRPGFELWDWQLNFEELGPGDLGARLERSRWFTVGLKLPGIVADALICWTLYLMGSAVGRNTGVAAAAAYSLNPAVIYNTASWGQSDAVWIALVASSLGLLRRDRVEAGASAYTLAALTKPQALAFAPLVVVLVASRATRRLGRAGLAAAGTFLLVFLPFLWGGTFLSTLEALWRSTIGGEPYLSCNAANLWLLLDGGSGFGTSDTISLAGPLTARALGLVLFLACAVLVAARVPPRGEPEAPRLALAAAVTTLASFAFGTELHENHLIAVLPFLALAALAYGRLWIAFGLLTATIQANLVLFDQAALLRLGGAHWPVRGLAVAAALLHTLAFAVLLAFYLRNRTGRRSTRSCQDAAPRSA